MRSAINLGFYDWLASRPCRVYGAHADAFVYGRETTQLERIFEAADVTKFPLFYSFDMLHWNKEGASDVMLNKRLMPYAKKDTYHRIDGKIVISTFNGAQDGTYLDGYSVFRVFADLRA